MKKKSDQDQTDIEKKLELPESPAHIEAVARRAWETFLLMHDVGNVSTVARFDGYAVQIQIRETKQK